MADGQYRFHQPGAGPFYYPHNQHSTQRNLNRAGSPQGARRPFSNDTPSPSRSPANPSVAHGAFNMYQHGGHQGQHVMMNGQNHQRYGMQQMQKFQHNHHSHHNQTGHHHNQHHQGGHINHQYNHSGGALPNPASHFSQNHQNGISDNQQDDMEEPGGEHWQAQQQWAEEARANASPHHQARTVAQVSKNLNLGGPQVGNEEHQEEERNRPVPVAKGGRQGWTAIDLGGQGLRALSDVLFRYEFLQKLYLNHNNLDHLPTTIGRLKSLVELDASGNQLRELPAEIGMLTNLERLMLVDNHLRTLPFELGHLYKLSVLGVEGNPLNEDDMKTRIMRMGTKEFIENLRDEMPDPEPPIGRDWLALEDTSNAASQPEKFTAFSYNILCDKYATKSQYGYAPARVLNWEHRKEIILGEILAQDPDIICLQELDKFNYDEFFRPRLAESGYKGYFAQKSRHETAPSDQARHIDGCGTFYKEKKYILLDSVHLNFGRKAVERSGRHASADMINRVWQRDDIGTVVLLENRVTGSRMIVSNAHFYWDPAYKDVKLIQVAVLMEELTRLAEEYAKVPACKNKRVFQFSDAEENPDPMPEPGPSQEYSSGTQIPVIICGDFNSGKDSAVYDLLSNGKLASKHEDLGDRNYGTFSEAGISHPFTLKSAYSSVGELSFTNYTPGFTDVLDYIWYSSNSLRVSGLLGDVDKEYLQRVPGFPNFHFPSDHLALMAEFVVSGKKLKVTEADFGPGSQRDRK